MMLEVRDLHAYYGKSHILQGVSLNVGAGEIVSILGRNGVGRSTTLKAIMGDVPPHGSIVFKDEPIAGPPEDALEQVAFREGAGEPVGLAGILRAVGDEDLRGSRSIQFGTVARQVSKVFGGGLFDKRVTVALDDFSFAIETSPPRVTAIVGEVE